MDKNRIIRMASKEDIAAITLLEKQTFSEPWTQKSFLQAIERKENIFLVCEIENGIAGYCLLYGMTDEGEIPTIATNPQYLRSGVATQLLQEMMKKCKSAGIQKIFLEVRESNLAARSLYEKNGFNIIGTRKDFYRFPTEDALQMVYEDIV